MIIKIKIVINWMNYHLGGLRDPECFFEIDDPLVTAIAIGQFGEF